MNNPTRIRAQFMGPHTLVKVLMQHDMESGFRHLPNGDSIPAHHINRVEVQWNGENVLAADWGPSVAKNPFWQFKLKAAQVGDAITVRWHDNQGDSRTDTARVLAPPEQGQKGRL